MVFACKNEKKGPEHDQAAAYLGPKKLPKDKAENMKKRFKVDQVRQTRYTFDWKVYSSVIELEGDKDLYIVPVQYSKDDEAEYRSAWGIPLEGSPGSDAGNVNGFSSFIIQSGTGTTYYTFVKLCPPPDPCPEQ